MEQVSSDEGIGTLAENLLEALREHPDVNKKIDAARRETRAEKKRMAMAMRQKALGTLGMTVRPLPEFPCSCPAVERWPSHSHLCVGAELGLGRVCLKARRRERKGYKWVGMLGSSPSLIFPTAVRAVADPVLLYR